MKVLEFKIQGMDCAEEVEVLRREVGPLVGGESQSYVRHSARKDACSEPFCSNP